MRSIRATIARALLLPASLALAATSAGAAERELAAPVDEFHEVEVATVGLASTSGSPVVLLREPTAGEVIPIFIGTDSARAIMLALRGAEPPRPMTHDLLGDVIGALDARLTRVYVDAIVDHTFLGMLELEIEGRDEPVRVDTRPSDAIALALRVGASLHVAPAVREQARLINYQGLGEEEQVVTALGITVMAPTDELREALALPGRQGVVVTDATGAARGAGIEAGALLLAVNGETPASPMDFLRLVHATPEGKRVDVRYWFEGETTEVQLRTEVPEGEGRSL